jgi:hypothetical protein
VPLLQLSPPRRSWGAAAKSWQLAGLSRHESKRAVSATRS